MAFVNWICENTTRKYTSPVGDDTFLVGDLGCILWLGLIPYKQSFFEWADN